MSKKTVETLIIGAGLSGIYAAYLLQQRNRSVIVLEARNRIGDKIYRYSCDATQ
jgi:monoamine oxidase